MYCPGIAPPTTSSTNSKPAPRPSASIRRYTSPNCPAPPVCFLCRQCPSAGRGVVSRYGVLGGGGAGEGRGGEEGRVRGVAGQLKKKKKFYILTRGKQIININIVSEFATTTVFAHPL